MKKVLSVLLMIMLVMSFVACSDDDTAPVVTVESLTVPADVWTSLSTDLAGSTAIMSENVGDWSFAAGTPIKGFAAAAPADGSDVVYVAVVPAMAALSEQTAFMTNAANDGLPAGWVTGYALEAKGSASTTIGATWYNDMRIVYTGETVDSAGNCVAVVAADEAGTIFDKPVVTAYKVANGQVGGFDVFVVRLKKTAINTGAWGDTWDGSAGFAGTCLNGKFIFKSLADTGDFVEASDDFYSFTAGGGNPAIPLTNIANWTAADSLVLLSTTPANGSANTAPNADIVLNFFNALDADNVAAGDLASDVVMTLTNVTDGGAAVVTADGIGATVVNGVLTLAGADLGILAAKSYILTVNGLTADTGALTNSEIVVSFSAVSLSSVTLKLQGNTFVDWSTGAAVHVFDSDLADTPWPGHALAGDATEMAVTFDTYAADNSITLIFNNSGAGDQTADQTYAVDATDNVFVFTNANFTGYWTNQ